MGPRCQPASSPAARSSAHARKPRSGSGLSAFSRSVGRRATATSSGFNLRRGTYVKHKAAGNKKLELWVPSRLPLASVSSMMQVITYNATLAACECGAQWQYALLLLSLLDSDGVGGDATSVETAILGLLGRVKRERILFPKLLEGTISDATQDTNLWTSRAVGARP